MARHRLIAYCVTAKIAAARMSGTVAAVATAVNASAQSGKVVLVRNV
jgi:hypothetical protein